MEFFARQIKKFKQFKNESDDFNKIVIIVILCFLIIAGILVSYQYVKSSIKKHISAFELIPSSAALIIDIKQPHQLLKQLEKKSFIWNEIFKTNVYKPFHNNLLQLDSILLTDSNIKNIIDKISLNISFHANNDNINTVLFIVKYNNDIDKSEIQSFIENRIFIKQKITTSNNNRIFQVKNTSSSSFYWTYDDNFLIISNTENLLKQVIEKTTVKKGFIEDKVFKNLLNKVGKNVDANIFINYKNFSQWIAKLFNKEHTYIPQLISNYALWSALDFSFNESSFFFNGYTEKNDSMVQNQNINLNNQEFFSYIPSSTAYFVRYYHEKLGKSYDARDTSINATERIANQCFDNKVGFFITTSLVSEKEQVCFIVKIKDAESFKKVFYVNSVNENNIENNIFKNPFPSIAKLYSIIPNHILNFNYFFCIDNYAIFGETKQNLLNTLDFIQFSRNFKKTNHYSRQESIYRKDIFTQLCWNPYKSNKTIEQIIQSNYKNWIIIPDLLKNIESINVQFADGSNNCFTQLSINYNSANDYEDMYLWRFIADTTIKSSIYHTDITESKQHKYITFYDINNVLYLLNEKGLLLWKKKIKETIKSNIYLNPNINNEKLLIVFNTDKHIYAMREDGSYLANFPCEIEGGAISPVSFIGYDDNTTFRLLLQNKDLKILNFDLSGKKVVGWNQPSTKNAINEPIHQFNINNKDFLCAIDKKGNWIIFDRKGKLHKTIQNTNSNKYSYQHVFINDRNNNIYGLIQRTNQNNLILLNTTGIAKKYTFNTLQEEDQLISMNTSNNRFVFLKNNNVLKIIDVKNASLKQIELDKPIKALIPSDDDNIIAIIINTSNEILLLQNKEFTIQKMFAHGQKANLFKYGVHNNKKFLLINENKELISLPIN